MFFRAGQCSRRDVLFEKCKIWNFLPENFPGSSNVNNNFTERRPPYAQCRIQGDFRNQIPA